MQYQIDQFKVRVDQKEDLQDFGEDMTRNQNTPCAKMHILHKVNKIMAMIFI